MTVDALMRGSLSSPTPREGSIGVVPVDQHGHAERRHEAHGVHFDLLDHARVRVSLHRIRSDSVELSPGRPDDRARDRRGRRADEDCPWPGRARGPQVQHVVKAGTWFGSYPCDGTAFSFVGSTVRQGLSLRILSWRREETLTAKYPALAEDIAKLTEGLP